MTTITATNTPIPTTTIMLCPTVVLLAQPLMEPQRIDIIVVVVLVVVLVVVVIIIVVVVVIVTVVIVIVVIVIVGIVLVVILIMAPDAGWQLFLSLFVWSVRL